MNFRRADQRRLVEKTAAYIKTLKSAITEKNKKINIKLALKLILTIKSAFKLEEKGKYVSRSCIIFYTTHNSY